VNSSRFPHPEKFEFKLSDGKQMQVEAAEVVRLLTPYITPERGVRIDTTVKNRTCEVAVVTENIYDRGNVSAVMRSAEAMGYQNFHNIETGTRFKAANRVTAGSEKWLNVSTWKSTASAVAHLKSMKYTILATHLDGAQPISDFDFTKPTALVLGNESDGVSAEMLAAADARVVIPMDGFVQSFNISVAAAICLYHIKQDRLRRQGYHGDLSDSQKMILRAEYILKTIAHPEQILERLTGC
jgi:tRNA (guanosine-2'-O-)-methyltransferase